MRLKQNLAVRLTAGLLLITTMAVPALAATGTVKTGGSTLRVRAQANTSCAVLTKLRDGTKVEVLETAANGWYKI